MSFEGTMVRKTLMRIKLKDRVTHLFLAEWRGGKQDAIEQGRPKRLGRVTNGGLVESKLSFLVHRK